MPGEKKKTYRQIPMMGRKLSQFGQDDWNSQLEFSCVEEQVALNGSNEITL
jgi:hypothetical protein